MAARVAVDGGTETFDQMTPPSVGDTAASLMSTSSDPSALQAFLKRSARPAGHGSSHRSVERRPVVCDRRAVWGLLER